ICTAASRDSVASSAWVVRPLRRILIDRAAMLTCYVGYVPPPTRGAPEAAGRRHTGNGIAVLQGSGGLRLCGIDFTKFMVEQRMTRPALTLRDLRVLLSSSAAKTGPNEDAVAVRATWEQTFNSGDEDKIAALYTRDALMFGSAAQLFTGTDG